MIIFIKVCIGAYLVTVHSPSPSYYRTFLDQFKISQGTTKPGSSGFICNSNIIGNLVAKKIKVGISDITCHCKKRNHHYLEKYMHLFKEDIIHDDKVCKECHG